MHWVEKIKQDQNLALREIYQLYRIDCVSWLENNYSLRQDEAIDVFQVAVMALYDSVCQDKVRSDTVSLKSFLYSIARNKALEVFRKKKETVSVEENGLLLAYITDEISDVQHEEQLQVAVKTMELLGHPCSTLIQLFYYQNLSMEEITKKMGYNNANTTKNQKYKCLQRLQKLYFSHIKSEDK